MTSHMTVTQVTGLSHMSHVTEKDIEGSGTDDII